MAAAEFTDGLDDLSRTLALVDAADAAIRQRFLQLIGNAQGLMTLREIETLISSGRVADVVRLVEDVAPGLNDAITAAYMAAGVGVAQVLQNRTRSILEFDTLVSRGVISLQQTSQRLVRELTRQQAGATAQVLQDGLRDGLLASTIALRVRGSIGLTQVQTAAVGNYRRLLTGLSGQALTRGFRDGGSDGDLRRAIADGTPLTDQQVERMVSRYERNALFHRAGVIAGVESLSAVNQGEVEMWQQAADRGEVDPRLVEETWHVLQDGKQRDHHDVMQGQVRMLGVPFRSGRGNNLRYPGDPSAPTIEVIGPCRCGISRRILPNPF